MIRTALALGAALALAAPTVLAAQWTRVHDQFYWPAEHNWVFRRDYPAADRLFNAFDYGHAILYETLWRHPGAPVERLEGREYEFLTRTLLANPPRVPLAEEAIEPMYARLVPEAKAMFEWAHILHRQLYDVLADERLAPAAKDAEVARILRYYRSRRDLAFSARPKSMDLMEGQPYSLAFRRRYPKFNGLIWAYHWLQVGLYEPLVTARSFDERQSGVLAALARFRQMLEAPPAGFPSVMPMTAAIAPEFARRYPEAAIIFDNLHGMHDVISDILADPQVPRDRKRAEILLAARRYRDDSSYVIPREEWLAMARDMGLEEQGGPAVGILPSPPRPSVAAGGHAHGAPPPASGAPARGAHDHRAPAAAGEGHAHGGADTARGGTMQQGRDSAAAGGPGGMRGSMHERHMRTIELFERMMRDPAIHERVMADTAMHRMLMEIGGGAMRHEGAPAKPTPPSGDPHAGHEP